MDAAVDFSVLLFRSRPGIEITTHTLFQIVVHRGYTFTSHFRNHVFESRHHPHVGKPLVLECRILVTFNSLVFLPLKLPIRTSPIEQEM